LSADSSLLSTPPPTTPPRDDEDAGSEQPNEGTEANPVVIIDDEDTVDEVAHEDLGEDAQWVVDEMVRILEGHVDTDG
jgi:hypothetical protein